MAGTHPSRTAISLGPPIAGHRLIADGCSMALVTDSAGVDWWCAPKPHSPPIFWSLLDPTGGAAVYEGVSALSHDDRPAGPTCSTTLSTTSGRVECWDSLRPGPHGRSVLVRLVRALDGRLNIVHRLSTGGFDTARSQWSEGSTTVGNTRLRLCSLGTVLDQGYAARTRLEAAAGEWAALVVALDQPFVADPVVLARLLTEAEEEQRDVFSRAHLPRHHPQRASDALAIMRACTYTATGAIVASPTTSLPEVRGGDRQFDYRYTWLRDAGLGASVAALLGQHHMAEGYLRYLVSSVTPLKDGAPPAPVADVEGHSVAAGHEVTGVAGWANSLPVRAGNDAATQTQYDALGMLVEAVSVYLQSGGVLSSQVWDLVRGIADICAGADPEEATNGIWELPEPRRFLDADVGRWLALDRAIWIARGWRPLTRRRAWMRARAQLRARVLGAIGEDGGLPQFHGQSGDQRDASALMVVVFGMLNHRDPRAARLVEQTLAGLDAWPYLRRHNVDGSDGFAPGEGAFLPVSWWAVAALANCGRVAEATERCGALERALPRLLAEEVDPDTGEALGNIPLVWSHAEAARAMYLLDAAAMRDRFGAAVLTAWRIGRFVSLKIQRRRPRPAPGGSNMSSIGLTGRRSSPKAEDLSHYLRTGQDENIRRRRRITALAVASSASMGLISLYQMGVIRRLPEPPIPFLDANRVDASGEAYRLSNVPDAALGLASSAVTLVLAAMGGRDRPAKQPWLPIALAAKVGMDAGWAALLSVEQVARHRRLCSYCVVAAGASFAMVPLVVPEARAAVRSLIGRQR